MRKMLIEVCDIQYGFPFDSGLFNDSKGIPLIRIRDVKGDIQKHLQQKNMQKNIL